MSWVRVVCVGLLSCAPSLGVGCASRQAVAATAASETPQVTSAPVDMSGWTKVRTPSLTPQQDLAEASLSARLVAEQAPAHELRLGGFDARVIDRRIKRRARRIRACYERVARRNPKVRGKVTVRLGIFPGGKVSKAEVLVNSTGSDAVARCVARRLRRMKFPPGPRRGQALYEYPFVFSSGT